MKWRMPESGMAEHTGQATRGGETCQRVAIGQHALTTDPASPVCTGHAVTSRGTRRATGGIDFYTVLPTDGSRSPA
jgi:hypothetical protein